VDEGPISNILLLHAFNKTILKASKLRMPITCENSKKVAKKIHLRRGACFWGGGGFFFFLVSKGGGILKKMA